MRALILFVALCAAAACSSQPETSRPALPDRPEALRPDGVEPSGLADVRNTLAAQRAETRARENALMVHPNTLSTHPNVPWYESFFSPLADLLQFLRNF